MKGVLFDSCNGRKSSAWSVAEKGVALVNLKSHRIEADRNELTIEGPYSAKETFVKIVMPILEGTPNEQFWAMALDSSNRPLGVYKVEEGCTDRASVHPRKLLTFLLGLNATGCIVIHNHPGGRPVASPQDLSLTRALKTLLDQVQIRLLDHLIIAIDSPGESLISLQERGQL